MVVGPRPSVLVLALAFVLACSSTVRAQEEPRAPVTDAAPDTVLPVVPDGAPAAPPEAAPEAPPDPPAAPGFDADAETVDEASEPDTNAPPTSDDAEAPPTEPESDTDTTSLGDDGWGDETTPVDGADAPHVRYFLEDVRVEGETRTRAHLLRGYVPFERGDVIDPESDDLEAIASGVRGTGWFSRVRVRLERGSQRGWVDLVIEVEDRNSIVVNQFLMGISEGLSSSRDKSADVLPYVAFSIAETNLLGTGNAITLTGLMSQTQQAVRVGFQSPNVFGSRYMLRLGTSFHNGREFYGHLPFVSSSCAVDAPPGCLEELAARNVVVFYRRTSLSAGIGRIVGSSFHWGLDWVGDVVDATSIPEAASEMRGDEIVPIDFGVNGGRSLVSGFRAMLTFDRRDDPNLTRRGLLVRVQGDVASRLFGSRYDYTRLQTTIRGWVPLPHGQVLRLSFFAGIVTGDAPFFTLFHVSDLTDLIPSRVLEMDIDRRNAPNLLGTSIGVMRAEDFAARGDIQYEVAIQRGAPRASLHGVNAFANVGLYMLSDLRELSFPPPGFNGASRFPVDLTFDLGLRIDTDIGLFQIGFSNLLGFINFR